MTLFDVIKNPFFTHKFVLQKIVCHLTEWERDSLMTHYDDEITSALFDEIEKLYKLYSVDHEPLEYILWYVEYGGLRFHVNKNTIIPRPETEYMIEAVREYLGSYKWEVINYKWNELKTYNSKLITLVDVGTGSGVLWLSILHSHASQIEKAFLIDISEDALAVAKKNYESLIEDGKIDDQIEVFVEEGNLFSSPGLDLNLTLVPSPVREGWPQDLQKKNIIVLANLPYIPDETFDTNPDLSIKYEPRVAFVGGDDGLDLYRIMFGQVASYKSQAKSYNTTESVDLELEAWSLQPSITMFLEMMTWQVDILRQEFSRLVFEEIKTFHFQIRIVKVTMKL